MKWSGVYGAVLVMVVGMGSASGQVLTVEEKVGVRSKPGQIFVLVEPRKPLKLLYEAGVCLQVQQDTGVPLWLETTHQQFNAFKAKPPMGWSVGPCDDEAGGK